MVNEVAAALRALDSNARPPGSAGASRAVWHWDLTNDRLDWNEGLQSLFGYPETATNAGWREERIHPDDRGRVKLSLERATIVSPGEMWSNQYRFRHADGTYVVVTERAYVVRDEAGPRAVVGAITASALAPPRPTPVR